MDTNIYDDAVLYDMMYLNYNVDIPFYTALARKFSGSFPILEFACGTGRVTLNLAKAGFNIVGIDISPEMLALARRKLAELNNGLQLKVKFQLGNMISENLGTKHGFVLVPFNSFAHVVGTDNQLRALRNFRNHLTDEGILLVDTFNPSVAKLASKEPEFKEVLLPDGMLLTRQNYSVYNSFNQTVKWRFVTCIYNEKGQLEEQSTQYAVAQMIFPTEWRLLLRLAGFKIVREFGDYQGSPFSDSSPKMMFLCKRA